MSGGTTPARCAPWAAMAVAVLCAGAAQAQAPVRSVAVGSVHVTGEHARTRAALRSSLERALASTDGMRLAPRGASDLLVRATLGKAERRGDTVRYQVSLFVEDRRSGALRMLLRGGATARGPKAHRAALEGAIRSALRSLARPQLASR
jgi:hypothetical protein